MRTTPCHSGAVSLNLHRRPVTALLLAGALGHAWPQSPALAAPNVVTIDERLVTAGQPTPRALTTLASLGFEAVIYLAPAGVFDDVPEEPALLGSQGIEFVHIPVPFDAPAEEHQQALSSALLRLQDKRVLVHCQLNMRASTMVFLHRVITRHEDPALAWEAVTRVWSPRGPWRQLVLTMLRHQGIAFEPY